MLVVFAVILGCATFEAGNVLGLFGTTVVPYNLFLGSRLARGQRLADMRLGLWASSLFALGLFVAGLSSVIAAPLAAGTSCDNRALAVSYSRAVRQSWARCSASCIVAPSAI